MKKVLLFAALFTGATTITFGQATQAQPAGQTTPGMNQEQMAHQMTDMMQQKLTLTTEQNKKMYDANLLLANKIRSIKSTADVAGMKDIVDFRDAAYRKILTNEQFDKYQVVTGEKPGAN